MNIFIIATHHQLIQLNRAYEQFNMKADETEILYFNPIGYDIDKSIFPPIIIQEFQSWTFKEAITTPSIYRHYVDYLKSIKKQHSNIHLYVSQYSTDYTLLAYSVLKPAKIFIMDEGTASFSVVYKRKKSVLFNWRLLIKSLVYKRFVSFPKKVYYYTQYHLLVKPDDGLVTYSFPSIINKIDIDNSSAIILGTTLSELDIISKEAYMDILEKLDAFLRNKGITTIKYYSHRKEDAIKLEQIKKLSWVIEKNTSPFELLYPQMHPISGIIVSFLSPILDTLSKQYSQIPVFIIVSPVKKMTKERDVTVFKCIEEEFKNNPKLNFLSL